jgi:predicted oxidoreductase (fatty acid repression mutant protein)
LNYILVEPTLHEQIVLAQIGDKGVQVIKEMLEQKVDKYKCFRHDSKGVLWFEDQLVVPKNPELRKKYWMKLIFPNFPCTPAVTRCIMISNLCIGGPE